MEYHRISSDSQVLVLNASYEPINLTNWKRAVILVLKEKAQVLSARVIRLLNYIKLPVDQFRNIRPSRDMIYRRDKHKCQYCGSTKGLTIDHVIPKSKGGGDTWENLVVACSKCNTKKGDKYLEQTGMQLQKIPKAPYNKVTLALNYTNIEEWREYMYA